MPRFVGAPLIFVATVDAQTNFLANKVESKQSCDYFGCTSHAACNTGSNVIAACGADAYCDFQWGTAGKCQVHGFEAILVAKVESKQSCDYFGCTSNAACNTGSNVIAACGAGAYCDFQWGTAGKCVHGFEETAVAKVESQQTCDYFGCTSNEACNTGSNVIAACGAGAYCDFQWGTAGKCVHGFEETAVAKVESQQSCDYFGCTSNAACNTGSNVIAACGAGAYCDFQWGTAGKCVHGFAEAVVLTDEKTVESKEAAESHPCNYYGCTSTADCNIGSNVIADCGAGAWCDMQWGTAGKCVHGFEEAPAVNETANKLESQETCAYYGCTSDGDCNIGRNVIAACGANAKCDMQWVSAGKCYSTR